MKTLKLKLVSLKHLLIILRIISKKDLCQRVLSYLPKSCQISQKIMNKTNKTIDYL